MANRTRYIPDLKGIFGRNLLMTGLLLILGSAAGIAQVTTGTILGTITDITGAVVPNAKVIITNTDTGIVTNVVTKSSGNYEAPYLINGNYSVQVDARGFKTFEENAIQLTIGEERRIDAKLQAGRASETITVYANGLALRTETSEISTTIDSRTLTETPNINNNPLFTVILVPGVVATGTFMDPNNVNTGDGARQAFSSFTVNGGQPLNSSIQLDGASDTSPQANEIIVMPNTNALAESHVITTNYSAQYGRTGGGVINMTTRSGTDQYHVVAFENFRNTALDANSYGNDNYGTVNGQPVRPKAPFNSNNFGATVGGPLNIPKLYNSHGKTFFFASYAGLRRNQGTSTYFTVPTALERTGDFSQTRELVSISGQPYPEPVSIYLPLPSTTTTTTVAPGQYRITRQGANTTPETVYTGPGASQIENIPDVLPKNDIDPTASTLINYYPLPNIPPVNADGTSNYFTNYVTNIRTDQMIVRVDENFSDSKRGFFRYTTDWTLNNPPNIFADAPTPHPEANSNGPTKQYIPTATLGFDWTLSPKDVIELRVNVSRLNLTLEPCCGGNNTNFTALGFAPSEQVALATRAFPNINVSPYPQIGTANFAYRNNHTTLFSVTPNYTKILNNMSLKIGGEYDAILYNYLQPYKTSMAWTAATAPFSGFCEGTSCTSVASSAPQGWAPANYLMGVNDGAVAGGEFATGDTSDALKNGYWAAYVQDDWKATRNLTLNLGVRWELQGALTDRFNHLSQFNPNALNETGTAGLYQFSGVNGDPRGQFNFAWKNWAPRIGFAYRADDKTVISGAYGLSYTPTTGVGSGAQGFGTDGFSAPSFDTIRPTTGINAGLDILATPWTNAFSGGGQTAGGNPLNPILLGSSVTAIFRNQNASPYIQQYNFAIQRQLPSNLILQVGYVGTLGIHLASQGTPINQTDDIPAATIQSAISTWVATGINPLATKVANPFYPLITTNTNLNLPTVSQIYLDEPFPAYGAINQWFTRTGHSSYQSLQVQVQRSFSRGLQFSGAYTFSKNMDLNGTYGSAVQGGYNPGGQYYAPGNLRNLDYSVSAFDQPHRGVIATIWQVPIGKGHRLAGHVPVLSQIIGGWQFSSITTFASGYPLSIMGTGFGRPNFIGDPRIPGKDKITCALGHGTCSVTLPCYATGCSGNYTLQAGYKLWFNPFAFSGATLNTLNAANPSGARINVANPYYYGNSPREWSDLRGPGIDDFAMNLSHNYIIHNKYNLYVRADAYNVFNRVQPGLPSVAFGGPNVTNVAGEFIGQNTSTSFGAINMANAGTAVGQSANLPRYIQISGKFSF